MGLLGGAPLIKPQESIVCQYCWHRISVSDWESHRCLRQILLRDKQ